MPWKKRAVKSLETWVSTGWTKLTSCKWGMLREFEATIGCRPWGLKWDWRNRSLPLVANIYYPAVPGAYHLLVHPFTPYLQPGSEGCVEFRIRVTPPAL